VTAPARLLSVRVQGFKSFADRTTVDFGPGISAIVGPNGSGKSNLADALRWALGEQGRALRARKSEDVVWAGSERRSAIGMADVTIMLDNSDGLLPVEYGVVELGRRLYRSGENEYLLNRTRVRLRDLVDLLDTARLADNAFLFIGQGMVDQALALRPEERRPLFEEVAGVRRHERRRRRAEEQLAEADSNLARVRDVLAELRPQARRLAAQAEQQQARRTAGDELADALLSAAHHRWHTAATRERTTGDNLAVARAEVDAALAALGEAEDAVHNASAELRDHADEESSLQTALDAATARLTELRLQDGRHMADATNEERERERDRAAIDAAVADLDEARRTAAGPVPGPDRELDAALAAADRALADALAEAAALRASKQDHEAARDSVRRAATVHAADVETARRGLEDAGRRADDERRQAQEASAKRSAEDARLIELRRALDEAVARERDAAVERRRARAALEAAEAAHGVATGRVTEVEERIRSASVIIDAFATAEGDAILERLAQDRDIRRLGDGLDVDPAWRSAVDAALAEALGAPILHRSSVRDLTGAALTAIVAEDDDESARDRDADEAFRSLLLRAGGGMLGQTIRRDGDRVAGRLLSRTGWVADLATALALQPRMPAGWVVTTRDGSAIVRPLVVTLGPERGRLQRRAEHQRAERALAALEPELDAARDDRRAAAARLDAARTADATAAAAESAAIADRQRATETERSVGRQVETATREAVWHEAQLARFDAAVARARASFDELAAVDVAESTPRSDGAAAAAIVTWEGRARELRATRDRIAEEHGRVTAAGRAAETRLAAAAAAATLAEERIARLTADVARRTETLAKLDADRERLAGELAAAAEAEADARSRLERIRADSAGGRARLAETDAAAARARDALRTAEDASRAAELTDMEARLALDSVRESVLVDLAALGGLGLERLRQALPIHVEIDIADTDDDARAYETALAAITPVWTANAPTGDPPSAASLAVLRRRYHQLGATNPFADREFAEISERLTALETQDRDLGDAIDATRRLIGELNGLIADQFRATFQALESAFDGRFRQLFGGGYARLELTEPDDLSATGIEIVARPPGKKPQPLAMLSGGERALTAVALLFAMLEVRPVPFCVLDEVDAALDEANIGRFTEALTELARVTQFVVITHNRGTIEVADALYGVTVGDDSVSRVISLRLDEATAIADRRRVERAADPTPVGP
jgi:chromosome segregation protein